MLSNEFLIEEIVGSLTIGSNIKLMFTQHFFDRLRVRDGHIPVGKELAEKSIRKVAIARKKMARLDPGQQFWVVDHENGMAIGLRRQMDDQFGNMVNIVGTVVTPCTDGRPGIPNGDLNPIINIA